MNLVLWIMSIFAIFHVRKIRKLKPEDFPSISLMDFNEWKKYDLIANYTFIAWALVNFILVLLIPFLSEMIQIQAYISRNTLDTINISISFWWWGGLIISGILGSKSYNNQRKLGINRKNISAALIQNQVTRQAMEPCKKGIGFDKRLVTIICLAVVILAVFIINTKINSERNQSNPKIIVDKCLESWRAGNDNWNTIWADVEITEKLINTSAWEFRNVIINDDKATVIVFIRSTFGDGSPMEYTYDFNLKQILLSGSKVWRITGFKQHQI